MKLGYWDIRGRANPARLMLVYAGVQYENVIYEREGMDCPQWMKDKQSLGLDFPNLPYLFDGEVKLTESRAIYRYLGRKFGLQPSNDAEENACLMLEGVLEDCVWSFAMVAYSPDVATKLPKLREDQLAKIKKIDRFLPSRDFIAGNKLTYIDFLLFEIMDWHRLLIPDILDEVKSVQRFMERFESLKPIAAHLTSGNYKKFPIFAPFAAWGGKDHNDKTW